MPSGLLFFPEFTMHRIALTILCVGLLASVSQAEWGNLKGRIVLDGDVPPPRVLIKAPIPKLPGVGDIPDESLIIDAKSKGIANVLVWLVAKKDLKIHPMLVPPRVPVVTLSVTAGRITPHIAVMRTDQTVQFSNPDPTPYSIRSMPLKNHGFNLLINPGKTSRPQSFKLVERLPVQLGDDIHPWMRGYILPLDHPYATVTDKDGNFEIKDLPVDDHEFRIWHEIPGYLVRDEQNPERGLIATINAGEATTLSDIKVPLKVFYPADR